MTKKETGLNSRIILLGHLQRGGGSSAFDQMLGTFFGVGAVVHLLAHQQTGKMVSRPGVSLGEVFRAGQEAYARLGYKGEWQYHHQGGLAGYQSREIKATAQTGRILAVAQALDWNPTLQGTKAEDTVLVGEKGPEILTATGLFPTEKVEIDGRSFHRPVILER